MLKQVTEAQWQAAAAFVGAAIVWALLLGQVYAWLERRRIDWVGAA